MPVVQRDMFNLFKMNYEDVYPESFDSGIQTKDVSHESLVFIYNEADKKLAAISRSLKECQDKAQKFINYCSLTLTALVSFNSYILATYEHDSTIFAIVAASFFAGVFIFIAMVNSFSVMGDSFSKAAEGKEPKTALVFDVVNAVELSEQHKFFLLNYCENLQAAIDYNLKILRELTSQLQASYHLLRIVFVSYVSIISSIFLTARLLSTDLAATLVAALLVH